MDVFIYTSVNLIAPSHNFNRFSLAQKFLKKTTFHRMTKLKSNKVHLVHPLGYRAEPAEYHILETINIMPPMGLPPLVPFLNKKEFPIPLSTVTPPRQCRYK